VDARGADSEAGGLRWVNQRKATLTELGKQASFRCDGENMWWQSVRTWRVGCTGWMTDREALSEEDEQGRPQSMGVVG